MQAFYVSLSFLYRSHVENWFVYEQKKKINEPKTISLHTDSIQGYFGLNWK